MGDMLEKYRGQIGKKTEDVIYRLVKRARLPRNRAVYAPGAIEIDFSKVPDWRGPKENISFLDFTLTVGEFPDAYIGRFLFNDQQSLTDPRFLPECAVKRIIGRQIVDPIRIPVREGILRFYTNFLDKICEEGDDKARYGETVHADADVIYHVNDRVVHGKIIAESKFADPKYTDRIKNNIDNPTELANILRDKDREIDVITEARRIAEACDFNPDHAEEFVKWMMGVTLRIVEVQYLQKKLGKE